MQEAKAYEKLQGGILMEFEEIMEKESVLWRECPEEFVTLDQTYKPGFILRAVICTIIAVGLTVAYLLYTKGQNISYIVLFVLWVVCAYSVLRDFLDANKLRKAEYIVTDNYVIFAGKDSFVVEKKHIGAYQFKTDPADHTALLAGTAIEEKPAKWRMLAVSEPVLEDEAEIYNRFVMYGVKDVAGLKAAMEQ